MSDDDRQEIRSEVDLEQALYEVLGATEEDLAEVATEWALVPDHVVPFEDAGVLTMNRGLVVGLANGSVYQVTILQTHPATQPHPEDGHRFNETDEGMPCQTCSYPWSAHSERVSG